MFSETPSNAFISEVSSDLTLRGPPAARFKENLLPNERYITTWSSSGAGFTNNVMTGINLIYLAHLTDRIPILPDISPSKHNIDASPIAFGEIFDLPLLRRKLGAHVLEWAQVKHHNATRTDLETLGCWSVTSALFGGGEPYDVDDFRNIDVSQTRLPEWIRKSDLPHASFADLVRFSFPRTRKAFLEPPYPSPLTGALLPPDEHLFCLDSLYFVFSSEQSNWDWDYCPPWRFAGQHLHWAPRLEELARQYLHRALALHESEPTPPYIAIHARRQDFNLACNGLPNRDCFPSIQAIAKRVEEVRAELMEARGLAVHHVVMTSDEQDSKWWADVSAMGWARMDHDKWSTTKAYGLWYPTLIDAVIQSNAIGFVGTERSTMSIVAMRRSESWHNGVARMMKWGTLDADNH